MNILQCDTRSPPDRTPVKFGFMALFFIDWFFITARINFRFYFMKIYKMKKSYSPHWCSWVRCTAGPDRKYRKRPQYYACGVFTIYDVYCFVGSLADGYSSKVYDGAYIKQLVDEQIEMLSNAQSTMQSLGSPDILPMKRIRIFSDIISCFELLIREGNALNAFVDSGSQADADVFQAARNAAREKLPHCWASKWIRCDKPSNL